MDHLLNMASLREQARDALEFIEQKWDDLRANARSGHLDSFSSWCKLAATSRDGHLDDTDHLHPYILYLPNDFITPGGRFMVQFYWDSYFINLSLLRSGKTELAKGIVENCFYLLQQHGMIISNRKRWAAGSQLPFLSQMVHDVFERTLDNTWLVNAVKFVEAEYRDYWLNSVHLTACGLSRYHAPPCYPSTHIAEITMDHEATWDLSPRFEKTDVLHLLPVDLNSNLFAYENDLAHFYGVLGRRQEAAAWKSLAEARAARMHELMWDDQDGLYYDYDFVRRQPKRVRSLATFFPLFHGLADLSSAAKVVNNLSLFELDHGLATCDHDYRFGDRQWNFPIGWAPLHWLAFKGMTRYGHEAAAVRIALKWLNLNYRIWQQTGAFFEKYDVQNGSQDVLTDRYRNQEGFGWTNAVFHSLIESLGSSGT
jgi:alpha,alpha-trehalase